MPIFIFNKTYMNTNLNDILDEVQQVKFEIEEIKNKIPNLDTEISDMELKSEVDNLSSKIDDLIENIENNQVILSTKIDELPSKIFWHLLYMFFGGIIIIYIFNFFK